MRIVRATQIPLHLRLRKRGFELGCPALESGSNWLTRMNGEESNPGVLTFRVKDQKLHGLRIIEP